MKLNHLILTIAMVLAGCGKKEVKPNPLTEKPPAKATLIFPDENAVCTSGTIISATQASVVFNWSAAVNADSYEVDITNLLTGTVTAQLASTNQLTVTLIRNTPYAWYVVSKSTSSTVTETTDTWKFYLAGEGTVSYSPFPAVITAPVFDQVFSAGTTSVNLSWTGSDVDNDITNYAVYFGNIASPLLFKSNLTDMFLNNVPVSSGVTYYWRVITKDAQGNTSDSGVYQFKVD
jgi:hypothetical protein